MSPCATSFCVCVCGTLSSASSCRLHTNSREAGSNASGEASRSNGHCQSQILPRFQGMNLGSLNLNLWVAFGVNKNAFQSSCEDTVGKTIQQQHGACVQSKTSPTLQECRPLHAHAGMHYVVVPRGVRWWHLVKTMTPRQWGRGCAAPAEGPLALQDERGVKRNTQTGA